tara:strand:+ start:21814 stop:22176 length:363 start_codon:yes stop_codon:yes gene_type:complete
MKIRIKENTIRFRLTKTEVATFAKTGYFAEHTEFGTAIFTYQLKAKQAITDLEADYENNTITIYFPDSEKKDWANSSKVGFENTYKTSTGITLFILVEKDFVCMDETNEDQSDNYPNPKA